jgi:hypothetical protein
MNLSVIMNCISNAVQKVGEPFINGATDKQKVELQKLLKVEFQQSLNPDVSEIEYRLNTNVNGNRDRCDVYAETSEYQMLVEIDATRADQLAKKMLSRYYYAHTTSQNRPTIYICLLYPGTDSMNPNECIKYMEMGKEVLLAMNSKNRFIGGFIKDNVVEWKNIG